MKYTLTELLAQPSLIKEIDDREGFEEVCQAFAKEFTKNPAILNEVLVFAHNKALLPKDFLYFLRTLKSTLPIQEQSNFGDLLAKCKNWKDFVLDHIRYYIYSPEGHSEYIRLRKELNRQLQELQNGAKNE